MKIVFVSNYFNHHQKPFCEAIYQKIGTDFTFVSTAIMREERRKLGYSLGELPEYVLLSYEGKNQKSKAIVLINEADVVIAGSAPNDMFVERLRLGKVIFRYSERPYKKEVSLLKKCYQFFRWHQCNLWRKNVYMLCASAYTASDYASVGMYNNRTYKWGYFPEAKVYNVENLLSYKKTNTIMWCGRFIEWKHPEDAVTIAQKLKQNGYDFHLNMVGTGVMENELKWRVEALNLGDVLHFLGPMSSEQVRTYMEEAGIYLFTSDRQEGWGAVLNESMNSACAVIASHAIGAVPYLLKDNENGLIYHSSNVNMLYEKVKYLLDYPDEQKRMGKIAYKTITETWNATVASERFVNLVQHILNGEKHPDLYESGTCSKAGIIKDDWFNE